MNKMGKVKQFIKDHKREIAIAGISAIGGGVLVGLGVKKTIGKEPKLFETFETFGWDKSIVQDIFNSMAGSNHCATFSGKTDSTIRSVGKKIIEHYESIGVDLDTPVNGFVLFQTMKPEDFKKFQ